MIELTDTAPDISVRPAEYQRLLGYPPGHELSGRARELADGARDWFARYGRPWIYAREVDAVEIGADSIQLEGVPFRSEALRRTLKRAEAHGAFLVAVGAGEELEQEARRLWEEGKPDEYFFLEVFGSAAAEHLVYIAGARLCAWAEERGMAVLPHYSPGYAEWDIGEQCRLLQLIAKAGNRPIPGRLEALPSGALRPKKSQLAVFGFTRRTELVRRLTELIPCENCPCAGCQYRRAPNGERAAKGRAEGPGETFRFISAGAASRSENANGPGSNLRYTVRTKALERWAAERLSLHRRTDGVIEALFRFDGTTCTNMGRPFTFHYFVELGRSEDGYPIRDLHCGPAPGDLGHTYMCGYLGNPAQLTAAIAAEKPFLGRPLSKVLERPRAECAPACHCEAASRQHKWGIVLETIHYALAHKQGDCRRENKL